jgi:pimeloyl-ACP methyl ester carboxylesterase
MATYLLVHGAFHGGWCWRRVADRLRTAGHEVLTPTLTGLGERRHMLRPEIDLDWHIRDILGVIEAEELADFILVGHSYGGMVVTGVADKTTAPMRALVYLDAFLPETGQAVADLAGPEFKVLEEMVRLQGEGWRIPSLPPEAFGVTAPHDVTWLNRHLGPHPMASFTQPIRLDGAPRAPGTRVYIHCTQPAMGLYDALAARLEADPAWVVHNLATGHDAMVTAPDALTEILFDHA